MHLVCCGAQVGVLFRVPKKGLYSGLCQVVLVLTGGLASLLLLHLSPQRASTRLNPLQDRELDLRGYKIPMIENLGVAQDQFDAIDFSDNEIRALGKEELKKKFVYRIWNGVV